MNPDEAVVVLGHLLELLSNLEHPEAYLVDSARELPPRLGELCVCTGDGGLGLVQPCAELVVPVIFGVLQPARRLATFAQGLVDARARLVVLVEVLRCKRNASLHGDAPVEHEVGVVRLDLERVPGVGHDDQCCECLNAGKPRFCSRI